GDPVGCRNDRLIARVEHGHAEVVDRLLRTRGHEDLVALVANAVVAFELRDDRIPQLVDALDRGVAREAALDRIDPGLRDVAWRVEVRLTGPETDDIVSFGLQAGGAGGNGERGGGLDALDASRNG